MESPAFYENLAARRAALPVLPKPADPKRGSYRRCGKCKGTGEAGFNRMNGDEYCYRCSGKGWQLVYSADERAQIEREAEWWQAAYSKSYQLRIDVRRIAQRAAEARLGYTYERGNYDSPLAVAARESAYRTERAATFWVREGLERMNEEVA